jgi:uncharacterized membrane protein YcaP (DUF421 family)
MGKRQVGELQLSELVCAIFISELATLPIGDRSLSLLSGVLPIVFIVSCEVLVSFLSTKFRSVKRTFDSSPDILINKGVLQEKTLARVRMTVEELLSEIRQEGASGISEVYYAILEASGKVSLILKNEYAPVSRMNGDGTPQSGMDHAVVIDGKLNHAAIKSSGKKREWVEREVRKMGADGVDDVFLFTVNDSGDVFLARRSK